MHITYSAPATLGLVAVALNAPGQELAALKTLQHARYVDGRDITSLVAILSGMGLRDAAARVAAPDAGLLTAYQNRTQSAQPVPRVPVLAPRVSRP